MSCDSGLRQGARAAAGSGIAAGVSKKAFFLGAAAAGTVLGGLVLFRYFSRRQQVYSPTAKPPVPEPINSLARPERVKPTSFDKIWGQCCTTCQTPAGGKGVWYNLDGRLYCQACAQGQANQLGVSLALPVGEKQAAAPSYPQIGRRTSLKPRLVKVGPVDNVAGYAVWAGNKDTGLTLVPDVTSTANGQAKINKSRWFVNYDRANKPVAGPFNSVREAQGMASLLAQFDWTKAAEEFSDDEIRRVTQAANLYREDLAFRQHLRLISGAAEFKS